MLFCRHYSDYMWLDRSYLRLSVLHWCPSDNGTATRWDVANRSGCRACFQLTSVVQLGSVFLPSLQPHPLPEQIQKLLKCRSGALIVVHVFLWALPGPAVHHPNLSLEVQLQWKTETAGYIGYLQMYVAFPTNTVRKQMENVGFVTAFFTFPDYKQYISGSKSYKSFSCWMVS